MSGANEIGWTAKESTAWWAKRRRYDEEENAKGEGKDREDEENRKDENP